MTKKIYINTPSGGLISLPEDSTPIDFAFAIHEDLGLHTCKVIINGERKPLNFCLKDGDTVEVFKSPTAAPNKSWLRFIRTSTARSSIQRYFKKLEEKTKSVRVFWYGENTEVKCHSCGSNWVVLLGIVCGPGFEMRLCKECATKIENSISTFTRRFPPITPVPLK